MNPKLPALACASLLLASCTPAMLQDAGGRIVNLRSGQEGRLMFLGGFRDRALSPGDPDNLKVTLGETVYTGRYTVLGSRRPDLGLSVGFGTAFNDSFFNTGDGGGFFGGGIRGSYGHPPLNQTRPGNLIARTAATAGGAIKTLACTFEIDSALHGIGSCQDSAGGSYSLQF